MATERKRFTLDLEPAFQRRLKATAALKGVSMRRYCIDAIDKQLGVDASTGASASIDYEAMKRLFELSDHLLGGKKSTSDSVELLREAREERDKQIDQ